jgi:hypothetical protein
VSVWLRDLWSHSLERSTDQCLRKWIRSVFSNENAMDFVWWSCLCYFSCSLIFEFIIHDGEHHFGKFWVIIFNRRNTYKYNRLLKCYYICIVSPYSSSCFLFAKTVIWSSYCKGKPGENPSEDGPTDYGASKPLEAIPGMKNILLLY